MPAELKCTVELARKIAHAIRLGSYWEPACTASGISYPTVRRWITQASREAEEGIEDSVYIQFKRILDEATAEAELALIAKVAETPDDWRAQAFVLERRHRERWGKQETTVNQVNVVVSDALVSQLADALAVANASRLQPQAITAEFVPLEAKSEDDNAREARSIETNTPQYLGVTKA